MCNVLEGLLEECETVEVTIKVSKRRFEKLGGYESVDVFNSNLNKELDNHLGDSILSNNDYSKLIQERFKNYIDELGDWELLEVMTLVEELNVKYCDDYVGLDVEIYKLLQLLFPELCNDELDLLSINLKREHLTIIELLRQVTHRESYVNRISTIYKQIIKLPRRIGKLEND